VHPAPRTSHPAPLCYILGTFPQASQTFIAREVRGLLDLGVPLRIFALRRRDPSVLEPPDREWFPRVVFVPRAFSPSTLAANVSVLASSPRRYFAALARLLRLPHQPRILVARALPLFLRAAWITRELDERDAPSRVHAHFALAQTEVAMAIAALRGIPFSFTAHARDIFATPSALREKVREAQLVVTCTGYNAEHLRSLCPELRADHVRLVHHGVTLPAADKSTDLASGGAAVSRRAAPAALPMILAAGRLVEKKGFDILVDACARLRDRGVAFTCAIAGDGPLRSTLERQVADRSLGGVVTLRGWTPPGALALAMREATLLAVPSRVTEGGDRDGIPNVILEAMSAGLPVVASATSGIPEAVEHQTTGLLVPEGDASALAEAIAALLEDAPRAAAMGRAGRVRVMERFDLAASSRQLAALFADAPVSAPGA
jgi:glycosyltransferase involved in cell wall biosynthesis